MTFGNDDNDDSEVGGDDEKPGSDSGIFSGHKETDTPDEFDVDMTPEPALSGEAEVECLGTYESMEAYLRSQVELLVIADGLWLLDCMDYVRVHEMLEGGEFRIWRDEYGRVFRRRLPSWPLDP